MNSEKPIGYLFYRGFVLMWVIIGSINVTKDILFNCKEWEVISSLLILLLACVVFSFSWDRGRQ